MKSLFYLRSKRTLEREETNGARNYDFSGSGSYLLQYESWIRTKQALRSEDHSNDSKGETFQTYIVRASIMCFEEKAIPILYTWTNRRNILDKI
jgi:hypothetical protein